MDPKAAQAFQAAVLAGVMKMAEESKDEWTLKTAQYLVDRARKRHPEIFTVAERMKPS